MANKKVNSKNDLRDINIPPFLEEAKNAKTVNIPDNITKN